jgi:hypothetical protein
MALTTRNEIVLLSVTQRRPEFTCNNAIKRTRSTRALPWDLAVMNHVPNVLDTVPYNASCCWCCCSYININLCWLTLPFSVVHAPFFWKKTHQYGIHHYKNHNTMYYLRQCRPRWPRNSTNPLNIKQVTSKLTPYTRRRNPGQKPWLSARYQFQSMSIALICLLENTVPQINCISINAATRCFLVGGRVWPGSTALRIL